MNRRHLMTAVAATFVLAVPASAPGAVSRFAGEFEAGGELQFNRVTTNKGQTVNNFKFEQVAITCRSGPNTTTGGLTFRIPVRRGGKFRTSAVRLDNQGRVLAQLRIAGRFKGPRSASGVMRVSGSKVPVDSGGGARCDSGRLRWSVQRGGRARTSDEAAATYRTR